MTGVQSILPPGFSAYADIDRYSAIHSNAPERFPTWNHVIEKESLKFKNSEHVLMRHRIYPMSKYRKSRATLSGHAP